MIELSITVKNEEKSMTKKALLYETLNLDTSDEKLQSMVREAQKEFGMDATDTLVRAKMVW